MWLVLVCCISITLLVVIWIIINIHPTECSSGWCTFAKIDHVIFFLKLLSSQKRNSFVTVNLLCTFAMYSKKQLLYYWEVSDKSWLIEIEQVVLVVYAYIIFKNIVVPFLILTSKMKERVWYINKISNIYNVKYTIRNIVIMILLWCYYDLTLQYIFI